jgi:FtsH-binding integral membrane protein
MVNNPYLTAGIIVLSILTIVIMILAITVSPYIWIIFVILFLLLAVSLWLRFKPNKSSYQSDIGGSSSSLDNY